MINTPWEVVKLSIKMQTAGPCWNLLCFLQIPPLIIPPVQIARGVPDYPADSTKKIWANPFDVAISRVPMSSPEISDPAVNQAAKTVQDLLVGGWKTEPQAMWRTQKHQPCSDHTGPTSLYRFRNFRDQRREWKFSLSVLLPDFNQNLHIGIQQPKTFKNGRCDHLIPCFFVYHNMWYSSSKILPWWIFDICPGKKSSFELVSKYINKKHKW